MPQWELDNADEMIEDLKKMDINITKFPNGILFSDENEAMIIMLKWSEYFEVAQ
jgi:hypothetical protein